MSNSDTWGDFAKRFRALPDPLRTLRADWHYRSAGNLVDPWQLTGGASLELRTQFDALARRAASHLPTQSSSNLLFAWLDALKAQSIYFEYGASGIERNADGSEAAHHMTGSVGRVCEASASYCDVLEAEALQKELAAQSTQQTPQLSAEGRASASTRARIDQFLTNLNNNTSRKVRRKDIWIVAGYKSATDFERFQNERPDCNQKAIENFNRVLGMSSEDFLRILDKKLKGK